MGVLPNRYFINWLTSHQKLQGHEKDKKADTHRLQEPMEKALDAVWDPENSDEKTDEIAVWFVVSQ